MRQSHRTWLEGIAVAAVALGYLVPLLLSRYVPGLDVPWSAAMVEVVHRGDDHRGDFLGYFVIDRQFSSYLTVYLTADLLADVVGGVVNAMWICVAVYVVTFVYSTRSLIRACGGNGVLALLAAPAAYSMVLEYGFVTYAWTYPMTFWLWALVVDLLVATPVNRRATGLRLFGIAGLSGLIAVTHPFAAVVAGIGAGLLVLTHADRDCLGRAGLAGAALVVGAVPMVLAVAMVERDVAAAPHRALLSGASLWNQLTTQRFVAVDEALAAAPVRLFGYLPMGWRFAVTAAGLMAAVVARHLAGAAPSRPGLRGRAVAYLLFVMSLCYFFTPYTFEWPRLWYAAQPRLLPILWVLGLVLFRLAPALRRPAAALAAPVAVAAVTLVLLLLTAFLPFARETADFDRVVARGAPGARTLGLIEQPPTVDREPASPFRHFAAYLLIARGGFVSHLPFAAPTAGNAGMLAPVHPAADSPPRPRAPLLGQSRRFDWASHGPGWDQFLIRDRDPDHRFDYFRDHADEVALVVQAGRWRLYRRR